jgi:hypothetical protein
LDDGLHCCIVKPRSPTFGFQYRANQKSYRFHSDRIFTIIATLPVFLRQVSVSKVIVLFLFRNSGYKIQPRLNRKSSFRCTGLEALKSDGSPGSIMISVRNSLVRYPGVQYNEKGQYSSCILTIYFKTSLSRNCIMEYF